MSDGLRISGVVLGERRIGSTRCAPTRTFGLARLERGDRCRSIVTRVVPPLLKASRGRTQCCPNLLGAWDEAEMGVSAGAGCTA